MPIRKIETNSQELAKGIVLNENTTLLIVRYIHKMQQLYPNFQQPSTVKMQSNSPSVTSPVAWMRERRKKKDRERWEGRDSLSTLDERGDSLDSACYLAFCVRLDPLNT